MSAVRLKRIEETKLEVRELVQEIVSLRSSYAIEQQKSSSETARAIEHLEQTTDKFARANIQVKQSILAAKKLQQQLAWQQQTRWFTPLLALAVVGIGSASLGSWLTVRAYSSPAERFKRDLFQHNQQRLTECINSRQDKCTLEIKIRDRA